MTKICLVGIDGLRLDVALEEAKTFRSLAESGTLATMRIAVPTISGPSWTSLLTGASYAEHGIVDNTFVNGRHLELRDFLSRIADGDPAKRTFAAADWPPLVDPDSVGPVLRPRFDDQQSGRHTVIIRDGEGGDYQTADAEISDAARKALADGVDASFVYFGEADHAAHGHGGLSGEYRAAIGRIDDHLRSLVDVIGDRSASSAEDWVLVITTDHGHRDEGGHGGGSAEETASFAVACGFASSGPGPSAWPTQLKPVELAPRLVGLATR